MTPRPLLVALALLSACTDYGRSDEIPFRTVHGLPTHSPETIAEAEEILGMQLVPMEGDGGVTLTMHPAIGELRGWTDAPDACTPVSWSEDSARVLAHELGHALGLQHVEEPGNVMGMEIEAWELTDEQVDTMRMYAWYMQHEC